jgi:queuine tRNA-ribosyltransferase
VRGAIRHFFNAGEMLGPILLSMHNLRFYQRLMSEMRAQIEQGRFAAWADAALKTYAIPSDNS